eukprot:g4691.t1
MARVLLLVCGALPWYSFASVNWNDQVVIHHGADTAHTNGAVGDQLAFGSRYTPLYIRHYNTAQRGDSGCLTFGSAIVVAESTENDNTEGCGWYGCRKLARPNRNAELRDSNVTEANAFYVQPPPAQRSELRGQCVAAGQTFVLVGTPSSKKEGNCGWYGCRVARVTSGALAFGHGGNTPEGVVMFTMQKFVPINWNNRIQLREGGRVGTTGGQMGDPILFGDSATTTPSEFYVRHYDFTNRGDSSCLTYGAEIVLALTLEGYNTGNCGPYGCRRLKWAGAPSVQAGWGKGDLLPSFRFYVRPPPALRAQLVGKCVGVGQDVMLSASSDATQTAACGW